MMGVLQGLCTDTMAVLVASLRHVNALVWFADILYTSNMLCMIVHAIY